MVKLGVLASGTGTILESILEHSIEVAVVVVDRPCRAVKVAMDVDIPVELVVRDSFGDSFDREKYSELVAAVLAKYQLDVIAMAGYGTVLGKSVFDKFPGRILNTHPSLLPKFKGWHAVRDALESGDDLTGCTVHVATLGVDEGPILAQREVPIFPDDSEKSLHERIKEVERELYPATIVEFMEKISQEAPI
ncbi:MAG: phosphoribosylglycinamide formyltransferase [Acidimicrobiales bacterium]|nr:phosphoribosylglycinamide formyltransferase [Acidimicrobiales bacterium]